MELWQAILGSAAFTAVVNAVIEFVKNRTGQKRLVDKAVNFTLLYNIQSFGKELLEKDSITFDEYEQFLQMYATYKALGGNGFVDRIKNEIDHKPIKN